MSPTSDLSCILCMPKSHFHFCRISKRMVFEFNEFFCVGLAIENKFLVPYRKKNSGLLVPIEILICWVAYPKRRIYELSANNPRSLRANLM